MEIAILCKTVNTVSVAYISLHPKRLSHLRPRGLSRARRLGPCRAPTESPHLRAVSKRERRDAAEGDSSLGRKRRRKPSGDPAPSVEGRGSAPGVSVSWMKRHGETDGGHDLPGRSPSRATSVQVVPRHRTMSRRVTSDIRRTQLGDLVRPTKEPNKNRVFSGVSGFYLLWSPAHRCSPPKNSTDLKRRGSPVHQRDFKVLLVLIINYGILIAKIPTTMNSHHCFTKDLTLQNVKINQNCYHLLPFRSLIQLKVPSRS